MKLFAFALMISLFVVSCGPSAEEQEKQRIQDSIKAEDDRLRAIEELDSFVFGDESEEVNDTLAAE
jgi:hypothetical protein